MGWVFAEEVRATRDSMRYGFAVGKVRVLETRTLDRSAYERLLDAPSFAEQRRILSETVYGRYLEDVHTAEGVERGLDRALVDFQRLLEEAELPEPVTRFFRLRVDYANLKAAIKARTLGASIDGLVTDRGGVPAERFSEPLGRLPAPYGKLAEELLEAAEKGAELAEIDARVDHAQFEALHRAAHESRSPFLVDVAVLLSDIANTRVLVRARSMGVPAQAAAEMLVPGGSLDERRLMALYARSPVDMAGALERIGSMRGVDTEGISEPGVVDIVTDNALMRLLRTARRVTAGPEPVIAYVLAREAEVQTLRVLLVGKMAGLDDETLRHRLRDSYR